jgi:hypothetical protein
VAGVVEQEVEVRSCIGFAIALCVLVVAAPAAAKDGDPDREPVAVSRAGEGVAPGAPEWVRRHVAEVTGAAPSAPRAFARARRTAWIGCRTVWAYRGYDNWLGMTLLRYYEQVSWCSNGFSIYSYGRDRWPETHYNWQFDGHIGSSITGGSYAKSAWTQGSFSFCLGTCYDHKYPWVTINVNADGGWSYGTGG